MKKRLEKCTRWAMKQLVLRALFPLLFAVYAAIALGGLAVIFALALLVSFVDIDKALHMGKSAFRELAK